MVDELKLIRDGDISELVINRPEKRNAFTDEMWSALPDLISSVDSDPAVKVLVVLGAGGRAVQALIFRNIGRGWVIQNGAVAAGSRLIMR